MSDGWYYAEAGNSVGPVALHELHKALRARRDASRILVWRHGFPDWMEAGAVPELATAVSGPPPLPPRASKQASSGPSVSPLSPDYRQDVQAEGKPRNWLHTIVVVGVALFSALMSKALGGIYWIPGLLIALAIWTLTKARLRDYTAWMLGVLIGHTLWMTVGHVTLYATGKEDPEIFSIFFDLFVVAALVTWGVRAQSVAVGVCVLVYQSIILGTTVVFFDDYAKISATGAGMHIALRTIGIGLAIYAIVRTSRHKREEEGEPLAV